MLGENTAFSEKPEAGARETPAVLCDRFVLDERLEQGRFGAMYRARDRLRAQDGRPHVAVLILPAEVARSPEQLAAFERELESVRMLSHPNIVRTFSLERDGDTAFLVLEWVDGESLRSVIESLLPETVCEADALGVVRAVGNALVYAHARGVVHGDIRPENVLVTERGEVRVLFTSACLARSAPFAVGPRDDVRGLAALAYELMSGAPPPIGTLYPRSRSDEIEPIDGLSRKRWKGLKSALSLRDGRISSVRRLLAALELPEPRAPRHGSRPDRVRDARRGGWKRAAITVVLVAGIAVLAAGGMRVWSERGGELTELSASVESGAGRAANLTREGLAGAKARLEQAGTALAAMWSELGERVEGSEAARVEAPEVAGVEATDVTGAEGPEATGAEAADVIVAEAEAEPAASRDTEGDAVPDAELFEGEELNDIGVDSQSNASEQGQPAEDGAEPAPASVADSTKPARAADDVQQAPPDSQESDAGDAPGVRPDETRVAGGAAESGPRGAARVLFSRSDYVVSESAGVAAVEVERDDARGNLSFVWWTSDGTARSGDDYADFGRRVEQFSDGEAVKVLYVPITSDSLVEDRREYFEIHAGVLSAEGSQNGALDSARVTIVDDDR